MNGLLKKIIGVFIFVSLVLSCEKKKTTVIPAEIKTETSFNVQPVYGADNVTIDQHYLMQNGWQISFAEIKFLLTDIKCGSNSISNDAFFNFKEKGTTFLKVSDFMPSNNSFSAIIGVDSSKNHLDPATWPSSSALNISNAGDMHWSWNPGYIFIKLEGRVDTIPDGVDLFDHVFTFHIGTDGYTRSLNVANLAFTGTGNNISADLKLDLKQVFEKAGNEVKLNTENSTHSGQNQSVLTKKIADNFVSAFSAK